MTRKEQLQYCRVCLHRQMTQKGIICGLTGEKANFQNSCDSYQIDDDQVKKLDNATSMKAWLQKKKRQNRLVVAGTFLSLSVIGSFAFYLILRLLFGSIWVFVEFVKFLIDVFS